MTFFAVESLSVTFGGLLALKELSTQFEEGSIHGVIGPNGAGKTTLINAISGLISASSGRIVCNDRDIGGLSPNRVAELGIARTFQHAEVFPDQSVLTNVMTGLFRRAPGKVWSNLLGTPIKWRVETQLRNEALQLLERFGIDVYAGEAAGELPFGVLKKVDLARALAGRPRVLMLDEPTSGLSEAEANEVIVTCRELADDLQVTLVIVEHNMRVVMTLADRITVLDHGVAISEGSPQTVQQDRKVIEAYLGEDIGHA